MSHFPAFPPAKIPLQFSVQRLTNFLAKDFFTDIEGSFAISLCMFYKSRHNQADAELLAEWWRSEVVMTN